MQKVISVLIDPSQSPEKANFEVNKLLGNGYIVVNIKQSASFNQIEDKSSSSIG